MRIDRLVQWFMPKEERFQVLFARNTKNLCASARLFAEIAKSQDLERRRVSLVELKGLEHEGDEISQQIFEALNATFITPMDREDLRSMAGDLDDIVDYFESVARLLVLFELEEAPPALAQFASILEAMAEDLDSAISLIWDLSNAARIRSHLVRVSEHENRGDELYQTVLADLFARRGPGGEPKHDPLEILKWKEIYDSLENACDKCKDTAHVLGNIMIKGL